MYTSYERAICREVTYVVCGENRDGEGEVVEVFPPVAETKKVLGESSGIVAREIVLKYSLLIDHV